MPEPIPATPVLRGADARRILDEMSADRPVDEAKKAATKAAITRALQRFKMVHTAPSAPTSPRSTPSHEPDVSVRAAGLSRLRAGTLTRGHHR
jgi:hypothetical protein